MSKKHHIPIRRDDDLAAIDSELEGAIERLAATNEKIRGFLESFAPPLESPRMPDESADMLKNASESDQEVNATSVFAQ